MPQLTEEIIKLRAERAAVVEEHLSAENDEDVDRVLATFTHPRYELMAGGHVHEGVDAVRAHHEGQLERRGKSIYSVVKMHHSDDAVIVEYEARKPAAAPDAFLPALAIFEFDGTGLVCERVYYDSATAIRELG